MSKNEQRNNGHDDQVEDHVDDQTLDGLNSHHLNRQTENPETTQANRLLKDRFLEAVVKGELGSVENSGTVITLKEFKAYFSDIKTDYKNSFLPAATLGPGQSSASHTKYLFRVRKGAYLVHPDVLLVYQHRDI